VPTPRDGVEYRIRPIRVDDLLRDRDFIMGLSPESRYTRMFAAMREPSAALLEQFVHVDYHSSMAFVGIIGEEEHERIIGVARYAADPNGRDCEFAHRGNASGRPTTPFHLHGPADKGARRRSRHPR
jgi:acetyltransferase